MWTNITILIMSGISLIFVALVTLYIIRSSKRNRYVKEFTDYRAVLEYHMEKAYDMVHKENILPFSLEAFRISDEDYDKVSKDFVRLVQKFIGPTMLKEFISFYGNEDTFTFNLLEFFSAKYEDDEIRRASLEQITESEEEVSALT